MSTSTKVWTMLNENDLPSDIYGKYEILIKDGSILPCGLMVSFAPPHERGFIGIPASKIDSAVAWRQVGRTI